MKRLLITVTGQVQGVGFRPHVYRVATQHKLTGWVRNESGGVTIEIQGDDLNNFITQLQEQLPPLAHLDNFHSQSIPIHESELAFTIKPTRVGEGFTRSSPDVSVCDRCIEDLFDPQSRYYRYPFTNCTNCGPRYTITQTLPYDRNATSMSIFNLCDNCREAYNNPNDRRHHAQAIACPNCGPQLSHSIERCIAVIREGGIVALKSVGGFNLICDATSTVAVKKLRQRKRRPAKPFAVMVLNHESAKRIVEIDKASKKLLLSQQRPIVLMPKISGKFPEEIAPNLAILGVMLPYTPLHYLLFNYLLNQPRKSDWLNAENNLVLVVTSANVSGSPLIHTNQDAHEKLSAIADLIVTYDREIVTRVDDSVMQVVADQPRVIRRARGFVPQPIALPYEIPATLAVGGQMKNTICITRGKEAFISQHMGELDQRDTIRFYQHTVEHLLKLLNVKPECVACDRHPDFYSTQFAHQFDLPVFTIQHHHAHLAACAVEYDITGEALGLVVDGFGFGEQGQNWGGELMQYQTTHCDHLGSLYPLRQPGGDLAAEQPWRMAASVLSELEKPAEIISRFKQYPQATMLTKCLQQQWDFPLTSSCGRLFDAASALLAICELSSYEGQAAMMLESKVRTPSLISDGWIIRSNQLSMLPLLDRLLSCEQNEGADLFHGTLAAALCEWIQQNARKKRISQIMLTGGCMQNKILSELLINSLKNSNLLPLYPKQSPVNDGGISLGQAWIAGNLLME